MPLYGKIILALLGVLIIAALALNFKIVQQSKAYVITRLGSFHTIWAQGPHF